MITLTAQGTTNRAARMADISDDNRPASPAEFLRGRPLLTVKSYSSVAKRNGCITSITEPSGRFKWQDSVV